MPLLGDNIVGRGNNPYTKHVRGLAPVLWYRAKEGLGATIAVNSGSLGSPLNATLTAIIAGVAGISGESAALSFDGLNSLMTAPYNATLAALTTYEILFLMYPTSSGESGIGTPLAWGNSLDEPTIRWSGLSNVVVDLYNDSAVQFRTITSAGFNASEWAFMSVAYDHTDDQLVHIRRGKTGVFTELAYSAQPPLTGAYKLPTSALNFGNTTSQGRTFAGLFDEILVFDKILDDPDRNLIASLKGA